MAKTKPQVISIKHCSYNSAAKQILGVSVYGSQTDSYGTNGFIKNLFVKTIT